MPESTTSSQSSSKIDRSSFPPNNGAPPPPVPRQQDIILFLIASRLLNALVLQTFFQPDEYFQALEPAWELAFGSDAGAWITWEWKNHLRSAIHPAIFALAYAGADGLAEALHLRNDVKAEILLVAPKIVQAVIAAFGDYYTWKLAVSTYGSGSIASAATLVLTVASPWQWFCSTRTFSNCLETTLTIVALYNWPWHWSAPINDEDERQIDGHGLRIRVVDGPSMGATDETTRLRRSLLFAAVATILRPTNILIWLALAAVTFVRRKKLQWLAKIPFTDHNVLVDVATWQLVPSRPECTTILTQGIICAGSILGLSSIIDRLFYQTWTFPPLNFLHFNVVQSLAIFYGNNNWHYYLSQGYPLLLLMALPFTISGMYQALSGSKDFRKLPKTSRHILRNLTSVSLFVPAVLSIISHKEVRFIYPLLPGFHVLAAYPLASFFSTSFQQVVPSSRNAQFGKRLLLGSLLSINLLVALYTCSIHNSGLVNVTHYLRHQFENYHLSDRLSPSSTGLHNQSTNKNMTVGFLMPCHSTPWRSHLQYPPTSTHTGIDAWALTCEPPLHLNSTEKADYFDEADQFYADPEIWLKRHMSRHPPSIANGNGKGRGGVRESGVFAHRPRRMFEIESGLEESLWRERKGRRPWPDYLIFFEQLEPVVKRAGLGGVAGGYYSECARIWNSVVHEDWRRTGDIVIWCLYEDRVQEPPKPLDFDLHREIDKAKKNVAEATGAVQERVERVVEKPFWKTAPLVGERKEKRESWLQWLAGLIGLKKKKREKSWWEGGNWS